VALSEFKLRLSGARRWTLLTPPPYQAGTSCWIRGLYMRVHHKLWRQVFQRDKGFCQYCGADLLRSFSMYWSATVDHVLAVSAGGQDTLENLKLSCTGCNGLLSRSAALSTFEDRKALVRKRIAEEHNGFVEWRKHLGRAPAF